MSTSATPGAIFGILAMRKKQRDDEVIQFFEKFEGPQYKYQSGGTIAAEFVRLREARKWRTTVACNYEKQLEQILKKHMIEIEAEREFQMGTRGTGGEDDVIAQAKTLWSGMVVAEELRDFFVWHEFMGYKYQPENDPEVEFDRLCMARHWGSARVKSARADFEDIFDFDSEKPLPSDATTLVPAGRADVNPGPSVTKRLPLHARTEINRVLKGDQPQHLAPSQNQPPRIIPNTVKTPVPERPAKIKVVAPDLIQSYFAKYEFVVFKYQPQNPPEQEFDRLCKARQWGTARIKTARAEFDKIIKQSLEISSGPKPSSALNAGAPSLITRVISLGPVGYGPKGLPRQQSGTGPALPSHSSSLPPTRPTVAAKSFSGTDANTASSGPSVPTQRPAQSSALLQRPPLKENNRPLKRPTLRESPIARFFISRQKPRIYKYEGLTATLEFDRFTQTVARPEWIAHSNLDWANGERSTYWESNEHEELKRLFYKTVEEHFNWLLKHRTQDVQMKDWEFVVYRLGVGTPPMSKGAAQIILQHVHTNIYDWIDYLAEFHEGKDEPPKPNRFESVEHLGIYCWATGRIYDLKAALLSGALALLLKKVGQYFDLTYTEEFLLRAQQCTTPPGLWWILVLKIEDFYKSQKGKRAICNNSCAWDDSKPCACVGEYLKRWKRLFNRARSSTNRLVM